MTRSSSVSLAVVLVLALAGVLLVPAAAQGCDSVDLCVHWSVDLHDGGTGEYLTDVTAPARGNRITIIRPVPEPPLGMFLDNEGCAQFDTQFAAGHKVVVYNEASYDGLIHVRAFKDKDEIAAGTTHVWPVHVGVIGDDDEIDVVVEVDADHLQNVMGVSVETLYRLSSLSGGLPRVDRRLFAYKSDSTNASADFESIRIGSESQQEKFVIAHEIGHWLVLSWPWEEGPGWSSSYGYEPQESMCDPVTFAGGGDDGGHSLRSAEYASGAMTEGFAHFVATAAFNNPGSSFLIGWFRYYKQLVGDASADLMGNGYLVAAPDGPVGGVNQWVQAQCQADFKNAAGLEISSEIDWMRFFWDFIAAPGDQPSFWDVVNLYKSTNEEYTWTSQGPVFANMLSALQDLGPAADAVRFEDLEPSHGLIND